MLEIKSGYDMRNTLGVSSTSLVQRNMSLNGARLSSGR